MVKIKKHCKADEHLSLALYWKANIPLYDVMMQKNPVAVLSTISKLPHKLKNVIWNKFPLCSFYREHVNAVICSPVLLLRVTPILPPPPQLRAPFRGSQTHPQRDRRDLWINRKTKRGGRQAERQAAGGRRQTPVPLTWLRRACSDTRTEISVRTNPSL